MHSKCKQRWAQARQGPFSVPPTFLDIDRFVFQQLLVETADQGTVATGLANKTSQQLLNIHDFIVRFRCASTSKGTIIELKSPRPFKANL